MTNHVTKAIAKSIETNSIVTIDADAADYDCLRSESENHVDHCSDEESGRILEAWGTDEDGAEWRVHARITHLA